MSSSVERAAQAAAPKYIPFKGVKPDLPGIANLGIPDGFYHYPENPVSFVHEAPGNGGTVTLLLQGVLSVVEGKNQFWQNLNKALNVDLDISAVQSTEYDAKLSVIVSGGDIPDVAQMGAIPGELPILEKYFEDLTPYLSGDAIKEYPGLASITPEAWKISMINGRIWGTPQPRPSAGSVLIYRGDTIKRLGLDTTLRDGKDLMNLSKELTNSKQNLWAWGEQPVTYIMPAILEMVDAPNMWTVSKAGKFTSAYESEQYKQALDIISQIWKAGYVEPDSFAQPDSDATWWLQGRTTLYWESFAAWAANAPKEAQLETGIIRLPKWSGGGFAKKQLAQAGYSYFTAYKKGSKKRIQEMMRIANYIAAPFGTKEFVNDTWGVEGVDYTLSGSDPVVTTQGSTEVLPTTYVSGQYTWTIYNSTDKALVNTQYNYLKEVMPTAVSNPALGLYSETSLTQGAAATNTLTNVAAEIVQGRTPLSEWSSAVATWKSQAGQKIAEELAQSYEQTHGKKGGQG